MKIKYLNIMKEYHSVKETSVYHNNRNCVVGNNIETENVRPGKGGKRLCTRCKELNKK